MLKLYKAFRGIGLPPQMMRTVFCLLAFLCVAESSRCQAASDTLYLYNGQTVTGKITTTQGEIFKVEPSLGVEVTVRRMQMNGDDDLVITRDRRRFFGTMKYMDPLFVELITTKGRVRIWRVFVRNIILGHPKSEDVDLGAESDFLNPIPPL